MNRQANILFMQSSSGDSRVDIFDSSSITNKYYQHLVQTALARALFTREGLEFLGNHLACIAQHASQARQIDATEQIARLMVNLPLLTRHHSIARYYLAQSLRYRGEFDAARRLFSLVAEASSPAYRARALQYIGVTYHQVGKIDEALPFYLAAGRVATDCDPRTVIESRQMVAILQSLQGDHHRAVETLEALFPIVRAVRKHQPVLFYSYLNNLAVEFGEIGRLNEAHQALNIALASPFAIAYTECHETRTELEAKRTAATPSIVPVTRAPEVEKLEIEESESVQPAKPKLRLSKSRSLIWLQLTTNSPPKERTASPTVDHLPLMAFRLDRLGDSIKPRAPPSRI